MVRTCLAKALRDLRLETGLPPVDSFGLCQRLVQVSVFAPTRVDRLRLERIDELERSEASLLAALAPDFAYEASRVTRGLIPRARPTRRPSIEETLSTSIDLRTL